ncbi:hypothetical protein HME9304_02302 [Flagellimonas maritima]|uniref:Uncharacterized protein n=1 Tax=Flagellimonas maritima TaxID=1383885 RepID=A0A2Z4LUB5_9FLAO|nr:hypothetical protein HME9304_02302 [Allomuricauda aurantiaca]
MGLEVKITEQDCIGPKGLDLFPDSKIPILKSHS